MIVTFIQKRENCGLVVINRSSDPKGVGSNPVEQWIFLCIALCQYSQMVKTNIVRKRHVLKPKEFEAVCARKEALCAPKFFLHTVLYLVVFSEALKYVRWNFLLTYGTLVVPGGTCLDGVGTPSIYNSLSAVSRISHWFEHALTCK